MRIRNADAADGSGRGRGRHHLMGDRQDGDRFGSGQVRSAHAPAPPDRERRPASADRRFGQSGSSAFRPRRAADRNRQPFGHSRAGTPQALKPVAADHSTPDRNRGFRSQSRSQRFHARRRCAENAPRSAKKAPGNGMRNRCFGTRPNPFRSARSKAGQQTARKALAAGAQCRRCGFTPSCAFAARHLRRRIRPAPRWSAAHAATGWSRCRRSRSRD